MARPANWRIKEGYDAVFQPTKPDGSDGSIEPGTGKFSCDDPAVTLVQDGDFKCRIDADGDAAATIVYEADGDLGAGTAAFRVEALAVFSEINIQATGGTFNLGEPTIKA